MDSTRCTFEGPPRLGRLRHEISRLQSSPEDRPTEAHRMSGPSVQLALDTFRHPSRTHLDFLLDNLEAVSKSPSILARSRRRRALFSTHTLAIRRTLPRPFQRLSPTPFFLLLAGPTRRLVHVPKGSLPRRRCGPPVEGNPNLHLLSFSSLFSPSSPRSTIPPRSSSIRCGVCSCSCDGVECEQTCDETCRRSSE